MKTTYDLIYPWTVDGLSFDTVTLRTATCEDFVAANMAAIEHGVMSHDGKVTGAEPSSSGLAKRSTRLPPA